MINLIVDFSSPDRLTIHGSTVGSDLSFLKLDAIGLDDGFTLNLNLTDLYTPLVFTVTY